MQKIINYMFIKIWFNVITVDVVCRYWDVVWNRPNKASATDR